MVAIEAGWLLIFFWQHSSVLLASTHLLGIATSTQKFSKVGALLNLPYGMTINLTFEKFEHRQCSWQLGCISNGKIGIELSSDLFLRIYITAFSNSVSKSQRHLVTEILKSQRASKFTIWNDYKSDFWEIWTSAVLLATAHLLLNAPSSHTPSELRALQHTATHCRAQCITLQHPATLSATHAPSEFVATWSTVEQLMACPVMLIR